MARFVPLSPRPQERGKDKKGYNPKSLQNLDPKAAQIWEEPKKSRTVYFDPAVKAAFWQYAEHLGMSVSELLERLGRGIYILHENPTQNCPPLPNEERRKTQITLTDQAWDGFRKICKERQLRPYANLLWLIANECLVVGIEEEESTS